MKKGWLVFCAAALLALMLVGCGKTAQEAAVLEPEPEAIEATVVLAEETSSVEPEPEEIPEPEPLPEGAEILLFGARVSTLTDGKTLFVDCTRLEECAELDITATEDTLTLGFDGQETVISLVRSDELTAGDGFMQGGAAYVPLEALLELPGIVSGTAEDGTSYIARELALSQPAENVNVPVLMYHAVSDDLWGYWDLFVSPQTIEEELLYLQENGFETIWFEDLSHVEDYEKPVILTFDDGYDDNYTELFPLLQKYNAKATIFVIPKAIGTPHKMTAEQVQELSRSGLVSIQSHTYSHGNLSTMDEETLIFEMEESQKYLAALTGQVPYAVCYPEGTRSELSIEVAGRYYDYGLLMNGQLYNTSDDPLRVKRFYVPRGYDLGSFRWSVQEAGTSRNW